MMSNRKHKKNISRFEPLALRPRLHRNEGFHCARSRKITQQYKFTQELLDPQVPHSVPQHLQHEPASSFWGRNLQLHQIQWWKHGDQSLWSQTMNSHKQNFYRIDKKKLAQICVRKNQKHDNHDWYLRKKCRTWKSGAEPGVFCTHCREYFCFIISGKRWESWNSC